MSASKDEIISALQEALVGFAREVDAGIRASEEQEDYINKIECEIQDLYATVAEQGTEIENYETLVNVQGDLITGLSEEVAELKKAPDLQPNRKKLSAEDVEYIHNQHEAGWSNADIAAYFDVNPATISRIVRGVYHAS